MAFLCDFLWLYFGSPLYPSWYQVTCFSIYKFMIFFVPHPPPLQIGTRYGTFYSVTRFRSLATTVTFLRLRSCMTECLSVPFSAIWGELLVRPFASPSGDSDGGSAWADDHVRLRIGCSWRGFRGVGLLYFCFALLFALSALSLCPPTVSPHTPSSSRSAPLIPSPYPHSLTSLSVSLTRICTDGKRREVLSVGMCSRIHAPPSSCLRSMGT